MKSLFIVLSFSLFSCIPEINNKQAIDSDGDGFTSLEGDCDDSNADIYPTATDIVRKACKMLGVLVDEELLEEATPPSWGDQPSKSFQGPF